MGGKVMLYRRNDQGNVQLVGLGSIVTIRREETRLEEKFYLIDKETGITNILKGVTPLSIETPLGKSLMGMREGIRIKCSGSLVTIIQIKAAQVKVAPIAGTEPVKHTVEQKMPICNQCGARLAATNVESHKLKCPKRNFSPIVKQAQTLVQSKPFARKFNSGIVRQRGKNNDYQPWWGKDDIISAPTKNKCRVSVKSATGTILDQQVVSPQIPQGETAITVGKVLSTLRAIGSPSQKEKKQIYAVEALVLRINNTRDEIAFYNFEDRVEVKETGKTDKYNRDRLDGFEKLSREYGMETTLYCILELKFRQWAGNLNEQIKRGYRLTKLELDLLPKWVSELDKPKSITKDYPSLMWYYR